MSVLALGDEAVTKKLVSDEMVVKSMTTPATITYRDTDSGSDTIKKGLVLLRTAAGAITMTIPDGDEQGDVLEILHIEAGNTATFTGSFRSPATQIQFPAVASNYIKMIWVGAWYVVERSSTAAAGATAVANLPVIS